MIESLHEIEKASSVWWRWMLWLPKWRRLTQEMVRDLRAAGDWRQDKMDMDAHIIVLEAEISAAKRKIQDLDFKMGEKDDALAHVGRFIAASHRITGRAGPGTIKELLTNAQRS